MARPSQDAASPQPEALWDAMLVWAVVVPDQDLVKTAEHRDHIEESGFQ